MSLVRTKSATPAMSRYLEIKNDYPDALLFYHMGDFYELFYDDARKVSKLLGLTLTSRGRSEDSIPMAGVPLHSAESYIIRLVKLGESVAICDQVGDPKTPRGPMLREVKRVITPGTLLEESFLPGKRDNWLMGVSAGERCIGVAELELSTGRFNVRELADDKALAGEVARLQPAEIVVNEDRAPTVDHEVVRPYAAWNFEYETCRRLLCEHFGVMELDGFGCAGMPDAVTAAGALLQYVHGLKNESLPHIKSLVVENASKYIGMDETSRRCLEIDASATGEQWSLVGIFDRTRTAMGARCLRRWFAQPLRDHAELEARRAVVAGWLDAAPQIDDVRALLYDCADLERILARVATGNARPRDLSGIVKTLELMPAIIALCDPPGGHARRVMPGHQLEACSGVAELLKRALVDDPPPLLRDRDVIRPGYDEELDKWRGLRTNVKERLAAIEARERGRTGLDSLKVAYNRVHGYYIEVPRSRADSVPEDYRRMQTLKNAERYTIAELREIENQVLSADENARAREKVLYDELLAQVMPHFDELQADARALSELDTLVTFAVCAKEYGYCRPELVDEPVLSIRQGRHPVVERSGRAPFTPNDLDIDSDKRLLLITGPNMGGKSTYMRQVAQIVLLAHVGSWVPAEAATIGCIDRIYTRIGATDNIASGHSTFMVEMMEAAEILHNATGNSLVLMDEIGRGTSTYDGMSLAWACAARLATTNRSATLFATHYLELALLEGLFSAVKNVHLDAVEQGDKIVFMHRVKPGATDRSHGLQVAKLAGIPHEVLAVAREKMAEIKERGHSGDGADTQALFAGMNPEPRGAPPEPAEPPEASGMRDILEKLKDCNPDTMAPRDALALLYEMRNLLPGDG